MGRALSFNLKSCLSFCAVLGIICALFLPVSASANFVINPSFEIGAGSLPYSCGTGCSYSEGGNAVGNCCSNDSTTIPDWTISMFTQAAGEYVPGGTVLEPVPDGISVAYTSGGTISQTIAPTVVVGDTYVLTGWITDANVENVSLYIGNGGFGSGNVYASTTGTTEGAWTEVSLTWTAPPSPFGASIAGDPITVMLFNQGGAGSQEFDDVSLTTIPEPASLPLLVGGLGFLGYMRRRKRAYSTVTAERP
jgi:hypothetical protein